VWHTQPWRRWEVLVTVYGVAVRIGSTMLLHCDLVAIADSQADCAHPSRPLSAVQRGTSRDATRTHAVTWPNVVETTTAVVLEGQLSNPAKPLRTVSPQGSRATSAARRDTRTTQEQHRARRETRLTNELGHYSNPAPASTSEKSSGRDIATPPPTARHRTQRRLGGVDVDALVDHYQGGATIKELAGRFSINRTTVLAHLDRRGVQRRATAKQWDHETLASAARSYENGSSLADIAEQHGLDPQTVANRLRRAGVTIRPRRGWS
jgi:transposase-like protein